MNIGTIHLLTTQPRFDPTQCNTKYWKYINISVGHRRARTHSGKNNPNESKIFSTMSDEQIDPTKYEFSLKKIGQLFW